VTRYVIGPDVAIRLAEDQAVIRGDHQILAPALLRSLVLSLLYQAVRRGSWAADATTEFPRRPGSVPERNVNP
jgi:hypothetical protein